MKFAEKPACDAIGIAGAQLGVTEIGVDQRSAPCIQTGIDQIIQTGDGECVCRSRFLRPASGSG